MRKDENPRWTCCREALGREPKAWEFMIWVQQRWRDYAAHLGVEARGGEASRTIASWHWFEKRITDDETHKMFDQWLKSEVASGKYKEVE